jgi:hypothetical protein
VKDTLAQNMKNYLGRLEIQANTEIYIDSLGNMANIAKIRDC